MRLPPCPVLLAVFALSLPLSTGCSRREPAAATPQPAATPGGPRRIEIKVSNQGYTPARIAAHPGENLQLVFRYEPSAGECGREVVVPTEGGAVRRELTAERPVEIAVALPRDKKEVAFTCGMNMLRGVIVLE